MKVAVYAIALNEEMFIERWATSARDADLLIIGDTGSTDRTVELAKSMKITVIDASVKPWRFDTARNTVLNNIPKDFDWCIALDLDEVLVDGWRDALENCPTEINLPEYYFVHDWLSEDREGLAYYARKVHRRNDFEWRLPIHECLYPVENIVAVTKFIPNFKIHHYPDTRNKEHRKQPLDLLDIAINEDPKNTTVLFYWSRTHYQNGNWDKAYEGFIRILELIKNQDISFDRVKIAAEKIMRYLAHIDVDNREKWLIDACACCPDKREPWAVLAEYYFFNKDYKRCLDAAEKAFLITKHKFEYECEPFAWSYKIYEFAALSAYALNLNDKGEYYKQETLRRKEVEDGAFC